MLPGSSNRDVLDMDNGRMSSLAGFGKPVICLAYGLPCITIIHLDVRHTGLEEIFSKNARRGLCNQVLYGVLKEALSFIRWLLEGMEYVQFYL
jgi:hypothetical protein